MSDQPTRDQIDDLQADLAYHERMAATIRERLAKHAGPNALPAGCACPGCGERDADRLEWMNDEDGQVRCEGCGLVYRPGN